MPAGEAAAIPGPLWLRAAVASVLALVAGLVERLQAASAEFRRLWARHDVRESVSGTKTFRVPEVGDIDLTWDTYPLPGSPGPVMLVFTAAAHFNSMRADLVRMVPPSVPIPPWWTPTGRCIEAFHRIELIHE